MKNNVGRFVLCATLFAVYACQGNMETEKTAQQIVAKASASTPYHLNPTPTPRVQATASPTPTPSPTPPPAAANECYDGIDNDGDGLIDADDIGAGGADMGCFGPNARESLTPNGYTVFARSADTRVIYVSSSEGDDGNDGLSPEAPVATIERGFEVLTLASGPNWLLLKRGDSWVVGSDINWSNRSGRSVSEKLLWGSYGYSPVRPLLKMEANAGVVICCTAINHVAFSGLHFYYYRRDPASPDFTAAAAQSGTSAITMVNYSPGGDLLLEDMRVDYSKGLSLQFAVDTGDCTDGRARTRGVQIRRSVVSRTYGYSSIGADGTRNYHAGRSSGLWTNCIEDLEIDESLFDHNGWSDIVAGGESSIYSHNIYLADGNGPATVRNTILSRGASHGLQLRPGGVIENNFFLKNAIATFARTSFSTIRRNVVLDGKGIQAGPDHGPRGWGMDVQAGIPGAIFDGNIVAHKATYIGDYPGFAFKVGSVENVHFENNIDYDWYGPSYVGPRANPFLFNLMEDDALPFAFPDPDRTIQTYYNQVLHPGSQLTYDQALSAFLTEAAERTQRPLWDARYTADAVNNYIRAGFAIQ